MKVLLIAKESLMSMIVKHALDLIYSYLLQNYRRDSLIKIEHNRSARTDSHQLLSYVLLTGVKKCGFVFPGEDVQIKTMSTGISLPLNVPDLDYYEILINNELEQKHFDQIITTT